MQVYDTLPMQDDLKHGRFIVIFKCVRSIIQGVLSCFEGHAEAMSDSKVQNNFNSYFLGKVCCFYWHNPPLLHPTYTKLQLRNFKKKSNNVALWE